MSDKDSRGFEAVLEKLQGGVDGYRERMAESFEKMGPELAQSIGLECFVWLTLVADHLGIKDGDDPGSLGYACLRAIDEKLEREMQEPSSPQVNPKALTLADFIVGAVEVLTATPHWLSIGAIENTAEFRMGREQWEDLREVLKDYRGTRSKGDTNG